MRASLFAFFVVLGLLLGLSFQFVVAQTTSLYHLSSEKIQKSPQQTLLLQNAGWLYQAGDNMSWKNPTFDDSNWQKVRTTQLFHDSIPQGFWKGIGWFRLTFTVDETLRNRIHEMRILHFGASEIYLDGQLVRKFGTIKKGEEESLISGDFPIPIYLDTASQHTLAIRYAYHRGNEFYQTYGNAAKRSGFGLIFKEDFNQEITRLIMDTYSVFGNYYILGGIYLALWVLHLFMYFFSTTDKANLWCSAFTGSLVSAILVRYNTLGFYDSPQLLIFLSNYSTISVYIFCLTYLGFLYTVLHNKLNKVYYILLGISIVAFLVEFYIGFSSLVVSATLRGTIRNSLIMVLLLYTIGLIIRAIYNKKPSAWILGVGVIILVFCLVPAIVLRLIDKPLEPKTANTLQFFGLLAVPFSMTLYMGRQNARLNRNLKNQLVENQTLSEKSLAQEKEKQMILNTQKELLERQVQQRTLALKESNEELQQTNEELTTTLDIVKNQKDEITATNEQLHRQKEEIEKAHENITASIMYAQRIQSAMLPFDERIAAELGKDNFFILYKPRNIVSGDFYLFIELENQIFMAAADCTGHGVPGAFMSMIGNQLLYEIITQDQFYSPDIILTELHKEVRRTLRQDETQSRDGMDIALIRWDKITQEAEYAGAMNSLYYLDSLQSTPTLLELKSDKNPIGGHVFEHNQQRSFTKKTVSLVQQIHSQADWEEFQKQPQYITFYLCTDGYQDQFGGVDKRKFLVRNFRTLLASISRQSMKEQRTILDQTIEDYMAAGQEKQIDDILIVGIRLPMTLLKPNDSYDFNNVVWQQETILVG